jgi:hypothetical protein
LPRDAHPAFLLWHQAAHSGDWDTLLSRPLTPDVAAAVWMLQTFPVYGDAWQKSSFDVQKALLNKG